MPVARVSRSVAFVELYTQEVSLGVDLNASLKDIGGSCFQQEGLYCIDGRDVVEIKAATCALWGFLKFLSDI